MLRYAAVGVTSVLLVGALVVSLVTARTTGEAAEISTVQPPRTTTPQAPAIFIASSHEDLSGSWLVPLGDDYALFTSTAFGNVEDNVPVMVGRPGHWSDPADALPSLPAWAVPVQQGGDTWEPEVVRIGSRQVMYFSATVRGTDPAIHCLGTAVSNTVLGPYTPSPQPIVCQRAQAGDIDAQVVFDGGTGATDGTADLVWKSDNNALHGHGTPLIWSQPLSADGLSVVGSPRVIYRTADAPAWAQPLVEAPQMVMSPFGGWWLFYSGGDGYLYPTYAIGVARCASVSGPCTAVGSQPFVKTNLQGAGPGEETFYRSVGSDWLLYSPWHSATPFKVFRPVAAARIGWTPAGPYLAQAGNFPPP